jgi:hypothetical protein
MRDLSREELGFVYGAGGTSKNSCKPSHGGGKGSRSKGKGSRSKGSRSKGSRSKGSYC